MNAEMTAPVTDLVNFQDSLPFKTTDSLKHVAAALSTHHNRVDQEAYSEARLLIIVLDSNQRILLPTLPSHYSYKQCSDYQLLAIDLPGLDIDLLDHEDADESIDTWAYAITTAELGTKQLYGGLQILYAAGTAPPDNQFHDQSVVIVAACRARDDFTDKRKRYTSITQLATMDWRGLNVGEVGIDEVFNKLATFVGSSSSKSDVRTTFEGQKHFIGGTARPLLAIEAGNSNTVARSGSGMLHAVALKVDGRRYVHRKHFARSKPANKRREDLLRREQKRNGTRSLMEVTTSRLALEGLRQAC